MGKLIKVSDLQLRDVIRLPGKEFTFNHMTVVDIKPDKKEVICKRPFVHCEDFSCTCGVLYYTGMETVTLQFSLDVILLDRINDRFPIK